MNEIDCRGLACPEPVIRTKQTLEAMEAGTLVVIVDNAASRDNVARFAESQGYLPEIVQSGSDFRISIHKVSGQEPAGVPADILSCHEDRGKTVVVFRVNQMGVGESELGRILLRAFLKTLREISPKPDAMVLYNSGVFLACQGSEVLQDFKELEANGTEILVCGTCLDYYRLKDQLSAGTVSNMYTIVETLMRANRVITP